MPTTAPSHFGGRVFLWRVLRHLGDNPIYRMGCRRQGRMWVRTIAASLLGTAAYLGTLWGLAVSAALPNPPQWMEATIFIGSFLLAAVAAGSTTSVGIGYATGYGTASASRRTHPRS